MEQFVSDVRLAIRRLRRARGFTLFAVGSIALGIGATTAIYASVRTLIWLPFGIPAEERLVLVTNSGRRLSSFSWADFADLRESQQSFAGVAAWRPIREAFVAGSIAEEVFGEAVSGDYFSTMGVTPLEGRLLQPGDERSGTRVVVISEQFSRSRLNGDSAIVGRVVKVGGEPFQVIGITSGPFHGLNPFMPTSVWICAGAAPRRGWLATAGAREFTDRSLRIYSVGGRLKPGAARSQAAAEVAVAGRQLEQALPSARTSVFGGTPRAWSLSPIREGAEVGRLDTIGRLIVAAVIVVLLIACSNLANLTLARATARSHETAVRVALGASRWRLIREMLIEGTPVVAAAGAIAAVIVRVLIVYFSTDLPFAQGVSIAFKPDVDARVIGMAVAAAALALVVFALWPALQSTRGDVRRGLGTGTSATPRWRFHRSLVAWQVAGSVALFLVAAVCINVIGHQGWGESGVRADRLAVAAVSFDTNGRDEIAARRIVDDVLASARSQPGIESVSASTGLPYGIMAPPGYVTTLDKPFSSAADTGEHTYVIAATPELFRTLGMRLVRGGMFDASHDARAPRVAVVSERLAKEVFHATDVVGRQLSLGRTSRLSARYPAETVSIVGVSADTDVWQLGRRGSSLLFVPFAQRYEGGVTFTAASEHPAAAVATLRSVIRRVDPELAVSSAGTGSAMLAGPFFLLGLIAWMATLLGAVALVLALAGLFGVLSHVVAARTREIGIRVALGAERSRIFAMILRDGIRPVVKGLLLGLGIGVLARFVVRAVVVMPIAPFDTLVFAAVPVLLLAAGFLACYLPAARASRVDPNVSLRDL